MQQNDIDSERMPVAIVEKLIAFVLVQPSICRFTHPQRGPGRGTIEQ